MLSNCKKTKSLFVCKWRTFVARRRVLLWDSNKVAYAWTFPSKGGIYWSVLSWYQLPLCDQTLKVCCVPLRNGFALITGRFFNAVGCHQIITNGHYLSQTGQLYITPPIGSLFCEFILLLYAPTCPVHV